MSLRLLSFSPSPVAFSDAKAHLRIDGDADDATLDASLEAATEWVQGETRQQLSPATFRLMLDRFPARGCPITLPRPPFQSVDAVTFIRGGIEQTLDPATYVVSPSGSMPGRVAPAPGCGWPDTDPVPDAVQIEFRGAGYADGDLPALLKTAVLMVAGHFHEHREAAVDRRIDVVPMAVESIVLMHSFPEVA